MEWRRLTGSFRHAMAARFVTGFGLTSLLCLCCCVLEERKGMSRQDPTQDAAGTASWKDLGMGPLISRVLVRLFHKSPQKNHRAAQKAAEKLNPGEGGGGKFLCGWFSCWKNSRTCVKFYARLRDDMEPGPSRGGCGGNEWFPGSLTCTAAGDGDAARRLGLCNSQPRARCFPSFATFWQFSQRSERFVLEVYLDLELGTSCHLESLTKSCLMSSKLSSTHVTFALWPTEFYFCFFKALF